MAIKTRAQRARLVAKWPASQTTQAVFARQHRIHPRTFFDWVRACPPAPPVPALTVSVPAPFVPVQLVPERPEPGRGAQPGDRAVPNGPVQQPGADAWRGDCVRSCPRANGSRPPYGESPQIKAFRTSSCTLRSRSRQSGRSMHGSGAYGDTDARSNARLLRNNSAFARGASALSRLWGRRLTSQLPA